MANILLIEPDSRTAFYMSDALQRAGHQCLTATSISDALALMEDYSRMLVILNARLPWTDSFSMLRLLEDKGWPVLFTTGDAGNREHLRALYQGFCSVLLTPCTAEELISSVDALHAITSRHLTLGALHLDTESRHATLDGEELTLTAQEFALLEALMQSPDAAVTREELLRTAWGYQNMGETRTVDVHVQRLRRKLGASCIETVYKMGYRLKMA